MLSFENEEKKKMDLLYKKNWLLQLIAIQTHFKWRECKPLVVISAGREDTPRDLKTLEQHSAVQSLIPLTHLRDCAGVLIKPATLSRRVSPVRTPIISSSRLSIQLQHVVHSGVIKAPSVGCFSLWTVGTCNRLLRLWVRGQLVRHQKQSSRRLPVCEVSLLILRMICLLYLPQMFKMKLFWTSQDQKRCLTQKKNC